MGMYVCIVRTKRCLSRKACSAGLHEGWTNFNAGYLSTKYYVEYLRGFGYPQLIVGASYVMIY